MKAARTVAPGDTRIVELPDPVPGPGEVVCRVLACATCGSDVQDWYVARKLPAILGHEPTGEVVAVGDGVRVVAAGDRVAIHHHAPCGVCARCVAGHETLCAQFRSTHLDPGGFAEQVLVQRELVDELLPLDGLDPVVATFTEPLACALRGQARVGVGAADRVLVVGAGCSGLLNIAALRGRRSGSDAGGGRAAPAAVFVVEPDAARRALAESWGAVPYDGSPVDVAIACTPKPDAIRAAADALDIGGRLLVYAPPAPGTPLSIDAGELFLRELTVTASWSAGPADMRASLAMLQGGFDPSGLIGLRVGLDGTGEALRAQATGAVFKAVVEP
ncbi:MAG: L-iditol 2-dehydrogenase [Solirubrobacteraceae bacterium]|nr:L-iditol 2-dehydrogenase [Solirubrobacteraceae bacterium]